MNKYEILKLENQLCFPLYATSKEVIKKYTPHLKQLDLTYTQYLAMLVLWENSEKNVETTLKNLGNCLKLDSGTLTSVLKNLEQKDYLVRSRSVTDERNLVVEITKKGLALKDDAVEIPMKVASDFKLSSEEAKQLYNLLYKILNN